MGCHYHLENIGCKEKNEKNNGLKIDHSFLYPNYL